MLALGSVEMCPYKNGYVSVCWCSLLQVLSSKQGRSSQFASQAERDAHLRQTIQRLKQAAKGQQEQLQQLQQQEADTSSGLNDLAAVSGSRA